MWRRAIHPSLAPTVSARDAVHAVGLLARPWLWQHGPAPAVLASQLAQHLTTHDSRRMTHVRVLDTGRNALRLALQAVGVGRGDEVLLQAFTCVSVPGPVLWVGATPVYVDIRPDTFTMNPTDLERKITPKAKAVIIQHTFGLPADLDVLLALARARGLAVIEDCAHALGATYRGRPVGTFGDAAIFSFGRDKVISSVFGGALALRANVELATWNLELPPRWWIARQLLHTVLAPVIRATYFCGGRELLRFALATNVLSRAITKQEKWGGEPPLAPSRLANALALRTLDQLQRLEEFHERRQALAQHYSESLQDVRGIGLPVVPSDRTHVWLRYAVRTSERTRLTAAARAAGIILRDAWYDIVVAPRSCDLAAVQYKAGSCPEAERAAADVVNLPTSPTLGIPDADRVLRVVRRTFD